MANKTTKAQMFAMIKALDEVQQNAEMVAFIDHELELLTKKANTKKANAETEANEQYISLIRNVLATATEPMIVSDIQKADPTLAGLSNQKVSSLIRTMIKNLEVIKVTNKKKSTFKLA